MKNLYLNDQLNMDVHDIIGNIVVDIQKTIKDDSPISKYRCSVYTKAAYLGHKVLIIVDSIEDGKLYKRLKEHGVVIWKTKDINRLNYLNSVVSEDIL